MEEWKIYRLEEIGKIVTGKTPSTKNPYNYGGDIHFITPGDLCNGNKHIVYTNRNITTSGLSSIKGSILPKGAICVSCIGNLGYTGIATMQCASNQQNNSIIVNPNHNPDFIYYVIKHLWPYFKSLEGQSTALSILNKSQFSKIEIPLPNKKTQNIIASILSSLDDKIELNNRINHNLEEQAQIVFDRIFNSDLTNNCLLSSIVDINPKRTLRKNEVARCIDMTYLNTTGSFPSGWEFEPYSGGMKLINGDTLMARITPCLENGKVAYINFLDKEETAFGSTEYIVFHAKEGYPNEMFYFLTRNKAFIEFATKNMNGSSGRQRVSGETIGNYIIPVLSEDDINELKTVCESTMKEILKNNLESRVLSEMRNTILPKLMSGELKINDLTC